MHDVFLWLLCTIFVSNSVPTAETAYKFIKAVTKSESIGFCG